MAISRRVVLLAVVLLSLGAQAQLASMAPYSGHGVSFMHPSTWDPKEENGQVLFSPSSAHIRLANGQSWITHGIIMGTFQGSGSPASAGEEVLRSFRRGNPYITQVGLWRTDTVGQSGSAITEYTNSQVGVSESGLLVIVERNGSYFFWATFCPTAERDECFATFDSVIRSIRFEGQVLGSYSQNSANVYLEPSVTLIRDTFSVPAGRNQWFELPLTQGSVLVVQFKVTGGLNNKIAVLLLDAANYANYMNHHPFRTYEGTSGSVHGVARYSFTVPRTDSYYLVLDNSAAWLLARDVKLYAYAVLQSPTPQMQAAHAMFVKFYDALRAGFRFPDFRLSIKHCGLENAFSTPDITICSELIESLADQHREGANGFVLFHELGHTLLREWGYPAWDNEDVADEFATMFMILGHQEGIARTAAEWWASRTSVEEALSKIWIDDRHSISPQRARNILRWLNQSNDLVSRWQKVLIPNMQTTALTECLNDSRCPFDGSLVRGELQHR